MRRFPVAAVPDVGAVVAPDPAVTRHLRDVVRLRKGESLRIYDDAREADAVVDRIDGAGVWLRVTALVDAPAPLVARWLVLGVPKGPAMDLAVRMGTELGMTHLVPALCRRSVARPDKTDRFVRIAEAAAQQCGRIDTITVLEPRPWAEALAAVPPDVDRRIALPGATRAAPSDGPAAIAVGPEGGFEELEIRRATTSGWRPVGLGAWVLRADTAVAAALASL